MNITLSLLRWLLLSILVAHQVAAQNVAALDEKNGFRDAKLGTPQSAFKGLVKDVEASVGTYAFYNRRTDKMKIGDIPLESITYRFYHNKLEAIVIEAVAGEGYNLSTTLSGTYGKPRAYQASDDPENYKFMMGITNNELRGLVWQGKNVKMTMWYGLPNSSLHNFRNCTVVISSKTLGAEVKRDEKNLRQQKLRKRADDL